jgi:aryl-alcohol dehydrogenase-like predicted oxidoreductase
VYFLHRDDPKKPVSEIMPFLDRIVKSGKAVMLGASNWTAARIEEANSFAVKNGLTPFSVSQMKWSYAQTTAGAETDKNIVEMTDCEYARYQKNGLKVMAFSSQAQGFFSLVADLGVENVSEFMKARFVNEVNLKRLETVREISKKTGKDSCHPNESLYNNNIPNLPLMARFSAHLRLLPLSGLNPAVFFLMPPEIRMHVFMFPESFFPCIL